MTYTTLAAILTKTSRLAFTASEIEVALGAVKARRESGADLALGDEILASDWEGIRKAAEGGVVFFHSPEMLRKRFLFVKVKGSSGGEEAAFNWYMSDLQTDEWATGGVHSNWMMAVTAISNVYRHEGHK